MRGEDEVRSFQAIKGTDVNRQLTDEKVWCSEKNERISCVLEGKSGGWCVYVLNCQSKELKLGTTKRFSGQICVCTKDELTIPLESSLGSSPVL